MYMGAESRYDWDEHNEGHVAAHRVEPTEVEEVLANDPIRIETRTDPRTGEERVLTGAYEYRPHFIRGVDAARKTQTSGDIFRCESQNSRRIPEETK